MKLRGTITLDSNFESAMVRHQGGDIQDLYLGNVKKIEPVKSECGRYVDFFVTQWDNKWVVDNCVPPESTDRIHLDKRYYFIVYNPVEECYNWMIKTYDLHINNTERWSSVTDARNDLEGYALQFFNDDDIDVIIRD